MARFYFDYPLNIGDEVTLSEDIVRHIHVLRLRANELITLFNGDGSNYLAKFMLFEKRKIIVEIIERIVVNNESNLNLVMAMSIIANDKFDLVLQKAVELGVTEFIPVYTQNTQRFKSDKLNSKFEHWQKIIIAASEQSGRCKLMKLALPLEFLELISKCDTEIKLILSPHHSGSIFQQAVNSLTILIGPEGGFTTSEVSEANCCGFNSLRLGNRILRAETAAIAATSLVQSYFGDL